MTKRTDHTLIWATHKASKGRARVPRSYLTVNPEWVEEKEPAASAPADQPKRRATKKEQK